MNPNFIPVRFYLAKYYRQTGQYDLWLKDSVENDRLSGVPDRGQSLQQLYAQGGFRAAMEEMAKAPQVGGLPSRKPFKSIPARQRRRMLPSAETRQRSMHLRIATAGPNPL